MATAPTPIDALPTPVPQTSDPANFPARADALVVALPNAVDQFNDAADVTYQNALEAAAAATEIEAAALVAADAAGLVARTTDTLALGAGTKTIHFVAAKPNLAIATKQVVLVQIADASIKMFGNIATTDGSDDITVTVVSSGVFPEGGSGSYAGWQIIDAAFLQAGATDDDIWAGTTDAAAVTPKALKDANAKVALTYAATVTPNLAQGWHRSLSASASFNMGAPTNCKVGDVLLVDIVNTAGSVVLAVASAWDRDGGVLGVLNPDNGARNKFIGFVDEVDGSGTMTRGTYDVRRGLA